MSGQRDTTAHLLPLRRPVLGDVLCLRFRLDGDWQLLGDPLEPAVLLGAA